MKFISVDPSLSNTAVVIGEINESSIVPFDYVLLKTSPAKKGEPKIKSIVDRSKYILNSVQEIIEKENPSICFAELPTGAQSASAAVGVGVSCCIIAMLCDNTITVTASDVKVNATGNKNATKKEIISYCENKYPDFPFKRKKDGSILEGEMEHVADSIAIAEAGLKLV